MAAQADPTAAAQYYFNTGAVLTNAGKVDDAVVAFDKVIAADPNKADAYYWKGVNMIGKATLKGDKMVAPPKVLLKHFRSIWNCSPRVPLRIPRSRC